MQKELVKGFRLSPQQQHLWALRQQTGQRAYQAKCAVLLEGNLDRERLKTALQRVVERHEILRTSFHCSDETALPVQVIGEAGPISIDEMELAGLSPWEQEAEIERLMNEAREISSFNEEDSPLRRVALVGLSPETCVLLLKLPALCADTATLELLVGEMARGYELLNDDGPAPEEPAQYADVSEWQNILLESEDAEVGRAYWHQLNIKALPEIILPFEGRRDEASGFAPASLSQIVEPDTTARLEELARLHQTTASTLLLACWQILLWRLTAQPKVVVGCSYDGRNFPELEETLGLLAKHLPILSRLGDGQRFEEVVRQVAAATVEASRWQESFSWQQVAGSKTERHVEPFSAFSFEFAETPAPRLAANISFSIYRSLGVVDKFKVKLCCSRRGSSLLLDWQYDTNLFEAGEIERLAAQYQALLSSAVVNPAQVVSRMEILSGAERQRLLFEVNGAQRKFAVDQCLHEMFEAQAARTPSAVAIVFEEEQVSYQELNRRANQLAHRLRQMGVGPEARVGLLLERSVELVVGALAVLKAGGAYVPLDAQYPQERLSFILNDAGCPVLLTDGRAGFAPPAHTGQTLDLDQQREEIARQSELNPANATTPDNLAYVIYTSGSTGAPKGTLVTHANVLRLFAATDDWFHFDEHDVWTLFHSIAFDFSVWELWGALLYGGRLVVVPFLVSRAAEQFSELLRREQVTVLNQTPSAFRQLMEAEQAKRTDEGRELALRLVIFGGEALDIQGLRGWFARRGDRRPQLVNMYGITETTVHVTYRPLRASDSEGEARSVIGAGIADLQVYVLDREMEPVPFGVAGEMYVGGAGVARGYLNRAELTAERFVPHPYSEEEGARLYRTGDLCVRHPDGELEYLGRIDQQVKIRGFRIELGEIEARLAQHRGVREAVVIARETEAGDKRLVAYVVAAGEGQQRAGAAELRDYLKQALPEYMIPSAFVTLDAMPLTTNGKIDRRALPAAEQNQEERAQALTAARTPVEEVLAGIWAEVLGVAAIGVDDNFFDLGGHSLLVTRLVSRVREAFKVELSLGSIFETPTLAQMGRSIEAAMQCAQGMEVAPVRRASREGALPLSFAQKRLWFIDQLEPGNPFYNIPTAFRLTGQLNVAALEQTLNEIVRRHEVLRTSFAIIDGQPTQVIAEPQPLSLPVEDLTLLAEDEREADAQRLAGEEAQRAFDLCAAPLVRARLLRLAEAEHVVLFTMHHIVSDGWSIGVLIGEVAALYKAFNGGQPSPLPELSIQYADFAAWQRGWLAGEVLDRQLSYWKRQLGGTLPVMELPTDYSRPPVYSHRGGQLQFTLSKEVSGALRELSREEGVTLFMTLLAAFQTLLSRYSGQQDVVVGTDIANRNRGETEQLIGFFVNQLVMRTDLSGDPSFRQLLGRVREVALGAYVHQDVPFEKLVEELRPERDLSRNPLFQVKFILQNAPSSALELPGLTLSQMSSESYTTRFDLTFSMVDAESGLFGAVEYSAELFAETTIRRMVEHFQMLLEGVVADPHERIMALPLMSAGERRETLIDWNDTRIEYARELCIHELFEEQAERRPDAVAVVFEDEQLSYAELNARANQLAHYLRGLGVGAEVMVGLSVERSIEMLVGLLGILKAGGAYVPLDPAYPLERLSFMIEDAAVPVLLTQERLLDNLPADWRQVVCLDADWETIAAQSRRNPSSVTTPDNLAYVIYTSGSTGKPKGVQLAHRGLVNMSQAQARAFSLSAENRVLQFASLSFDASIFEVVMSCATGATLYLAHRDRLLPGSPLAGLLREHSISNVTLPPSALAQLPETGLPALQTIIVAGEACGAELVERWARGRRFFNAYGPSEATVWSSVAECVAGTGRRPHIGRPIDNTQIYLLDQNLEPVPVGVVAELHIGGDGLARCYLGRPELTAERFLPNPFSAEPGRRMYSTGDVARFLNDGNIEFAGRVDHQVKVRGHRIELGEVEAALDRHPAVRECVVVAREDEPGDKRLVAYIVTGAESAPTVSELRGHLKEALPEYMMPSAFVMMDALPVSPSGKVERRALPAPDAARPVLENAYVAARTPAEEVLAAIFAEVLEVDAVGAYDSFFELGGHSLLATQLISRIREAFDVELSLRSIFETPSVTELAQAIEATRQAESGLQAPPMVAVPREGSLPLSFAQQRLWFIDQLEPGSPVYNLPAAVRLRGELNFEALERTVNEIVRRHEILRTTFATENGQPAQLIAPFATFALPLRDLRALPEEEREAAALRLATAETKTPFDLGTGPLMRVHALRLDEQEHVLLFTMHHCISDGWSMGVMVREVAALYTAFSGGEASPLPELPLQYADFAAWQREWLRGETLDAQLAYWKQQLRGAPALLELPTTRTRPATQNFRGDRQSFVYPASLSEQLKALSQREKSTLFMTLLAAFATQLHRYSGQEDIVLGTDVANRNRAETESLIGFFVNQLVLRADLSGNPTFSELLVRVREMTLGAYAHQDMPFDKLVESLRPDRAISRTPLFQAKIVLLNAPLRHLELPGLTLTSVDVRDESGTAKFDLVVTLMDTAEGLIGYMEYNTDLFDRTDIARLIDQYGTLLNSIVARPDSRLSALEMLSEAELREREIKKRERAESSIRKLKSIKPKPVSLPQGK